MIKIWSELPGPRLREQLLDVATVAWVAFWGKLVLELYQFLAMFAGAGRTIRDGGRYLTQGGVDVGTSLQGIPVIGERVAGLARDAFARAGQPLTDFGTELETFILVVAFVIALILGLVTLGPWLYKYVPWRWERLARVRAAHRAIRRAPDVAGGDVEKVLAMRAVTRLGYPTLLEYTPDPLGDWSNGRHDRLARAELASVGLQP